MISSRKIRHGRARMTSATTNQPFFTRDGDSFIPTPVANGPWDPKSLHGRVIIGLPAFVIEQRHGGGDFVPARLTVDMFRLPNIMTPIEIKTKLIRDGRLRPFHRRPIRSSACTANGPPARSSARWARSGPAGYG